MNRSWTLAAEVAALPPRCSGRRRRKHRVSMLLAVLVAIEPGCGSLSHSAESDPPGALRLGAVDFPTSGALAAQPHFLRGVAALHSFWYDEALEAFHAALHIDRDYAMAWWGVAMTSCRPYLAGSNDEAGRRALANIRDQSALTARERAYIAALRVFYADGTLASRTVAYAAAMQRVHRDYPDDLEAAAFYALALLGHWWPYAASLGRQEKAGAVALEVYRRNPSHPGAAHYIIHAFDDPALAGRALAAARHYAKIAPDAPHALHMPSHIFLQLGLWPETAASNEVAWAASEAWVRRKGVSPAQRDYHNYHWLIYACLQQGRHAKAAALVEQFLAMRTDIPPESIQYFNRAMAAFVIETGGWDRADSLLAIDSLATTREGTVGSGSAPGVEICGGVPARSAAISGARSAVGSFVRAFAAAFRGDPEAGKRLQEMSTVATDNQAGPEFWRICVLAVAAASHARAGEFGPAIIAMREATALEEALGRNPGPPPSFKPPHELFGEILLRAGRPAEAMAQFKQALDRHPNRALALLGQARAEAAMGDAPAARASYARLVENWRDADRDLPALREAREFLRASSAPARPRRFPARASNPSRR